MTRYEKFLTVTYAATLFIAALDLLAWRPA